MMTDEKIKLLEESQVEAAYLLRADFAEFIRVFHWYTKKEQFVFKNFHKTIIKELESIVYDKPHNLIISIPVRFGKLIADETPVLTKEGWKNHGDLKAGDYVIGLDGKFKKVLAISPKAPANCCVEFSDGDKIYCHENHEWVFKYRPTKKIITRETKWLFEHKLYSGVPNSRKHKYLCGLPLISPIVGEEKELPVKPYSLGVWLGNGTNTKPYITHDKKDIATIQKMIEEGYVRSHTYIHKTTGVYTSVFKNLNTDLNKVGMCYWHKTTEKHIPDIYLSATIEQRLWLLAGLIDTDGYLDKEGRYHFYTTSEKLKEGFISLISSFGWRASVCKVPACTSSSGIKGKKDVYSIGFNVDREIPCQLERKKTFYKTKNKSVSFKSVTKGDYGKIGNCIQVEDGIYLVGRRLKPTHNSVIMRYFLAWTYTINRNANNIYTSYSDELVRQFSGEVRDLINSPLYRKLFGIGIKEDTSNKGLWQISNGGSVRACSVASSITGFGAGTASGKVYGGAILCDDLLKSSDARSELEKEKCITYFNETLLSRRNAENTPIIVIMQRLSVDDLVGYLKRTEADFKLIEIPALNEHNESIWPERFSTEALLKLQKEQPGFFAAQYMQNPIVEGGNLFKDFMFVRGPMPSYYDYTFITCDTASTSKTTSDYTAAGFWGVSIGQDSNKRLYLLDLLWDKIDAAQIEDYLVPFIKKHAHQNFIGALIEPKGHGIYLNQRMPMYNVPMQTPEKVDEFFKDRRLDKVARANVIIPQLVNNPIIVGPEISDEQFESFKRELLSFPDGEHDDMCLVGDTLVATLSGNKKIKDIKVGDKLITPLGLSEVTACCITGYKKTITKFGLEATADHKVFNDVSFDKLVDIMYDVLLDKLSYKGLLKWQYKKLLYSMVSNTNLWGRKGIICLNQHITLKGGMLKAFTSQFGSITAGRKFLKGMWFITKMAMCLTTTTAIWSVYQGRNILRNTLKKLEKDVLLLNGLKDWPKIEILQKRGTQAKKEENGIAKTLKELWNAKDKSSCASIAEGNLKKQFFLGKIVNTVNNSADGAMINTISEKKEPVKKPVYNLTTKAGCFYANGILVSNCDTLIDAVKFCYNREPSILDVL